MSMTAGGWDASNTISVIALGASVILTIVLFRLERQQRIKDRDDALAEREHERRDALVDVRLLEQWIPGVDPPTVARRRHWFRISLVGGNIHTSVFLKRVAWRVSDDEWEEIIVDEPPYIRLSTGQMQHIAPTKTVQRNPCEVEITWLIDNETHGRRQSVVIEPWT